MKLIFAAVAILAIIACEGPTGEQGPMGPAGEQGEVGLQGEQGIPGERGPQGETGAQGETGPAGAIDGLYVWFDQTSFTLNDETWDDDGSYLLYHNDFAPGMVLGLFVKRFYTNTGSAYFTPISEYLDQNWLASSVTVQIVPGCVRIYDPERNLEGEIVVVMTSKIGFTFTMDN